MPTSFNPRAALRRQFASSGVYDLLARQSMPTAQPALKNLPCLETALSSRNQESYATTQQPPPPPACFSSRLSNELSMQPSSDLTT